MAFDKDLRSLMQSLKKEARSLADRLLADDQKRSNGDLGTVDHQISDREPTSARSSSYRPPAQS